MRERFSAYQLDQTAESVVITLACTGDIAAFSELVRRCQNRVRNFMRRLCNHPDHAEDLAQQVFLKAWSAIHQLRNPEAFHGWLNRIMISIWMEEVRRKKIEMTDLDDSIPVEDTDAFPGARIDLDAALAQLPASMRLCIVLSYNEGLSHQEISDAADIPLGTVKANIARGTARLRLLLSDYRKDDRGRDYAG